MDQPCVFYVKCRPGDVDAWPIARDHRVIFVGYPPWRNRDRFKDVTTGFRSALYDLSEHPRWASLLTGDGRGYRSQVTQNATLAKVVIPGSYVIVPRPQYGLCHIGEIAAPFELVDSPAWAEAYLALRRELGVVDTPAGECIADVVQCWRVHGWTRRPFPLLPRWITYRLLSRNTAGRIYDVSECGLKAHQRIRGLLNGTWREAVRPIAPRDEARIASGLVEWLAPSSFEHLVVDLLQLEAESGIRWHHIGGSGDGGVDGIAVAADHTVSAVLQCKWYYDRDPADLARAVSKIKKEWPSARVVLAILLSPRKRPASLPPDVELWLLPDLARLVGKHSSALPLARSLGVQDVEAMHKDAGARAF